ncbi:MAG: cyclic pyranopterin monophosphate synthase MoaC [Candidatus Hodarchaeales archaeon]|jgi:cyclic pyranopterin phosphate synthase
MAIDISFKEPQKRIASATGTLFLSESSINRIRTKNVQKGDPLENAKIAAIHAVKKTPDLVLMAHPIPIEGVSSEIEIITNNNSIEMKVTVISTAKTGVEIEALAGVMNGLLAIFDMVKMYEKDSTGNYPKSTRIDNVHVLSKRKE